MRDSRLDKLANVLVTYSVAVKKDDLVRISGSTVALPLIRAVYREVLRAGGHPVLRLVDDECTDIFFAEAGPKQLAFLNPLAMQEIETIDCTIGIWADANTKSMSRVDPARQAAASQARKPIMETFLKRAALKGKRKLRWTGTQFPCEAAAQDAERSLSQYEDFVFGAGLLDRKDPAAEWRKISERQQRLADYLNKTREIRFRTPAGTDLRVGVRGRRWINCDGHENFPDGEVFTGPIEDATEGTVVFSFPAVHGGREVHDIRLTFKAGKVVDAYASKGEDFLIQMLDQDKGARILGEIAIGTNYAITEYTKNTLFDEKIGGTFHAAVGSAYPETGGKNTSGLHWDMVCDLRSGGVIEADGKVISKNGRFTRTDWPR
ncbi:MAG TPA: aminopeptidase [Phycisphaerae bacterium]|mgnify:FL=1|nr:aminopeptidase [Phycisphaerae bacterium]HOJ75934.1 aminopeptidase [Phycisphaerae bacterium]HPZ97182.1 aminopeptidase [Phycisphaerae bacterium]